MTDVGSTTAPIGTKFSLNFVIFATFVVKIRFFVAALLPGIRGNKNLSEQDDI